MCTYVNKTGLSRESFFFRLEIQGQRAGGGGDARAQEREFFFFTHCLSFPKVHLSHTLDHLIYMHRQSSVPAIAGLLLGVVVALILIPISGNTRLLL